MGSYRKITVRQDAHRLRLDVYRVAKGLPAIDRWGLGEQMRRAGISVGANIAEGAGRNGDGDFARFVNIALG